MPQREYQKEVGVSYRHLQWEEQADSFGGESELKYVAYHHPTHTKCARKIAILGDIREHPIDQLIGLLNKWNSQPESGWQYYF